MCIRDRLLTTTMLEHSTAGPSTIQTQIHCALARGVQPHKRSHQHVLSNGTSPNPAHAALTSTGDTAKSGSTGPAGQRWQWREQNPHHNSRCDARKIKGYSSMCRSLHALHQNALHHNTLQQTRIHAEACHGPVKPIVPLAQNGHCGRDCRTP